MPTLEELEALRVKPEQTQGTVVAPPSLQELAAATNPALDTTLDQRSSLNKNLEWQEKFEPGFYRVSTGESQEAERARVNADIESSLGNILGSAGNSQFARAKTDAAWEQTVDATVARGKADAEAMVTVPRDIARGAANVVLDTVQAPGYLAKAFHEADIFGDDGVQFEYSWDKPLTSLLFGVSDLTQELQNLINPKTADPTLGPLAKFPEALGSAAAFMGLGWASGARTAGTQSLVSGGLGAASGGTSQYEEALAYGASPEDALLAYGGGALFGASEGFPGYFFLKRLNQLGGGKIMEKLNAFGMQGESTVIREAVKGAITEMVQEGLQTVGSNWVASDLAGYDPTRTLGENFWDNVITGGMVGSLLGGGMQMVRDGQIREAQQKLEEEYLRKIATGDFVNDLATPGGGFGHFTPVGDYLKLNLLLHNLEKRIDARADEALAAMGNDPHTLTSPVGITLEEAAADIDPKLNLRLMSPQTVWDEGSFAFDELTRGASVNKSVEKALLKPTTNLVEALAQTPVVTTDSQYASLLADLEKRYQTTVNMKAQYLEHLTPEQQKSYDQKAFEILQTLEAVRAKKSIADSLLAQAKNYAAKFLANMIPDTKLIIMDSSILARGEYGSMTGSQQVQLPDGTTSRVGILYLNLDELGTEIYSKDGPDPARLRALKRRLYETINHELGHAAQENQFMNTIREMNSGTPEQQRKAYRVLLALKKEYGDWLRSLTDSSQFDMLASLFALQRASDVIAPKKAEGLDLKEFHIGQSWAGNRSSQFKSYAMSFPEFFAEMTARLATTGNLDDGVLTEYFKPILAGYKKLYEKYPEFADVSAGRTWRDYLWTQTTSYKLKEEIERIKASGSSNLWDGLRGAVVGLNPENFAGLRHQLDRWNKGLALGLNLLQLERVFAHVPQFGAYRATTEAWAEYQRTFADKATETLENWRSLGKEDAAALAAVLYEESEARENLPPAVLSKRLNGEALVVYQQVREQLNRVLDEMQATTLLEANREFATNAERLAIATKEITSEFTKLKNSGYFPYVRFGDWTITARARNPGKYLGQDFEAGELITFQAFESRAERDAAYTKLRNELGGGAAVAAGKMRESEYTVQGMPRSILLALRNRLQADGQLSAEVEKAIEQSLEAAAPFKNFRNHFKKKQGIHGYSEDAFRTFAHYIRAAAGNISRVRYAGEMRESIDSMQSDVQTIQVLGGNATARQEMVHWLRRHFDYIMNPANELAALRGVGFVAYLGFNVKSAFVNSMQMLTTVYPYLSSRYGDVKAVSEISKAGAWLRKWVFGKKDFINAKPGSKELRIADLISRGNSEGWLDQSLATELAIAASENSLDRSLYLPSGKRWWHNFSRWSAWPFHMVEKTNRYVTAIAAYNLAYAETQSHEKAVLAAKLANQQTHFENARWNRPEFLRGKKSAALLFTNFVQNQLFFVAKDPGAVRYFCVMFLLAGAMGLPGAEDLIDVMDAAISKLNKELGMKNPKTQLRVEARKFLDELGANPDLVLHGISQDSFGLGQVGELTGLPIPRFDLSRSLGMGNIIPGTEIPGMILSGAKPGDVALESFSQAAGASGNLVEDYYRALFSREPSEWKRMEKLAPLMSVRNVSKAMRYAAEGKERAANGVVIADFTPYDIRTGLEIAGQGLGFPIREVQQGWEREFAIRDATNFYKTWQMSVQRTLNIAYMQEDREAITDAWEELREYNETVPMPEMGIKAKDAKAAIREFIKSQYKAGAGFSADRKYHRLMRSLEEAFPGPYGSRTNTPEVDRP